MNLLHERLNRGIQQCDHIEQRACLAEDRLLILNQSIKTLARLIDVSYVILLSSEKEKMIWLKLIRNENFESTNPIIENFFYRLELYMGRSIIDHNERRAYMESLRLLQSPLVVSSGLFLNMKEDKKMNNK